MEGRYINISGCRALGLCINPEKIYRVLISPVTLCVESISDIPCQEPWEFDYNLTGLEVLDLLRYDYLAAKAFAEGKIWERRQKGNSITYSGYCSRFGMEKFLG